MLPLSLSLPDSSLVSLRAHLDWLPSLSRQKWEIKLIDYSFISGKEKIVPFFGMNFDLEFCCIIVNTGFEEMLSYIDENHLHARNYLVTLIFR